jgi:hypothetical protein
MSDELAPFFESRETRMGRLPAPARTKLEIAAAAAPAQTDFVDKQFVSLWISRRVGLPREDVLNNFDRMATSFFGPGVTATGAYDAISKTYGPAPEAKPEEGAAQPPAAEDAEFAPTDGMARVGKGFFGQLRDTVGQSVRAAAGGFEGFGQQTPAGLYSQAAAITGAPALPSPMANPEYAALKLANDRMENPYQFTEVSSNEINMMGGGTYEAVLKDPAYIARAERMGQLVREMDTKYRADWKAWADSELGGVSQEYRRLADFWYKLSDNALERWNVTPEFQQTTIGQFMVAAGSVPATAALAAMGPGGWLGMESSFYAQVEGERMQAQGAYDPTAALPANLASAVPQMVLERALGVERLMNSVLKDMPKMAGKVRFGDFAKIYARQSLVSAVEEGVENPSQGAWNDYMASLTYDQKREVLTGEGAKKRLVEGVSGFILGGLFGGGITTLETVDTNRRVAAGQEYLTTKDGQPYAEGDFTLLRSVNSDQEILAQAPDADTGRVLLAAANGDKAAQADYNNRTLSKLFVKTEGEEVAGMALGQINGVPVVKMADGMIVTLDMTVAEDRAFVENLKKEVVRAKSLQETVDFLGKSLEDGRTIEVSEQEKTLQDFIAESKLTVDEAATRIGVANDVNAANLPAGVKPEDVAVLGANVAEYQQGVYRDTSHIFAGGNALTAVEEVAEGYIKKRLTVGDVREEEVAAWRKAYEEATGAKTETAGQVSNVEWFSKRVVDYAVANREAVGLPASLNSFFRTLGEHLKTVFRLAQRLAKMKRDGKLDDNFEAHLKAALGQGNAKDAARGKQQAQYEALFGPQAKAEGQATPANMEKLKAKLTAEDLMLLRARAESEPAFGINAKLSPQAQAVLDAEGYGDVTFSLAPLPDGQLMAVHNTSAMKLKTMDELGGMPVPSVAVIRPGVSQFTSFGDITLVLPPHLVDPQAGNGARVFNADVYSPRFPQGVRHKVSVAKLRDAWDSLGKGSKELGFTLSSELDEDAVAKDGIEAFEDASAVMLTFLKDKGVKPDLVYKDAGELPPELLAFKGSRWEIADDPKFKVAATAYMREQLKTLPDVAEDVFDEEGNLDQSSLNSLAGRVTLANNPELDRYDTKSAMLKQIEAVGMDTYKAWVKEKFGDVITGKVVRDYNERTDKHQTLPFNLDTIVRIMRRSLRDGEGFNYGVASIRSNVAKEFKTVRAMKAAADQIISGEKMNALKEETSDEFTDLADKLRPYYRYDAKGFGYLDQTSQSFKELATEGVHRWKENFKDVPAELMQDVKDFLEKLANMPTEYFEAKIQRGVPLAEIAGAVIPSDTPDDVRAILKKHNYRVIEYPRGDQAARTAALSNYSDMTFALAGPQTPAQSLKAQAAKIQAKRLAASGQLLAAIQAGQSIPKRVAAVRRTQQSSILARLAVPLTTRLGAIAPSLKTRMRKFEFDLGQSLLRDMEAVTPFLRGMEGMKDTDAAVLDLALKNGDTQTRDALLNAYQLQGSFAQVQALLDATRARAIAAGYEVGQVGDYFPRQVIDVDGLMTHYYGAPQAGQLEIAIADASAKALAQGRVLTLEERIEVVNTVLRGYGPKDGKPSNIKARKTDIVDMNANAYYADSAQALVSYVESMNSAIAKREFFGKDAQAVPPATAGLNSRINLEASIGAYVETLIAAGEITRAQQKEVSDLLESRFATQASSEFIKAFKTLGYITTMGKITSAITQIQDLAFSLYENGVFDTMVAAAKAGVKKSKISRKELGLEAMAEEFKDSGKLAALLNLTFKITGLHYMDGVGKEAITNAKFARMSREAAAGKLGPRSTEIINRIFAPADRARVIAEFAAGAKTEDTLFAVFNVLADYQPITASEYPEAYLRHPNGRVFYMLKSYTLKQIDSFRREGITLIVNGNAKQKAIGFRNLTHLAALLFLVGMPVDWIKDAIMGRDPQLPDLAVDNLFKLIGVSRWNLWQFRDHKDPVRAAMELVTPPAPFLSYPISDVFDAAKQIEKGEDIKPGDFASWRILPFFGDPIYWLIGGGRVKVEKRRLEREKHLSGNRVRNR